MRLPFRKVSPLPSKNLWLYIFWHSASDSDRRQVSKLSPENKLRSLARHKNLVLVSHNANKDKSGDRMQPHSRRCLARKMAATFMPFPILMFLDFRSLTHSHSHSLVLLVLSSCANFSSTLWFLHKLLSVRSLFFLLGQYWHYVGCRTILMIIIAVGLSIFFKEKLSMTG